MSVFRVEKTKGYSYPVPFLQAGRESSRRFLQQKASRDKTKQTSIHPIVTCHTYSMAAFGCLVLHQYPCAAD